MQTSVPCVYVFTSITSICNYNFYLLFLYAKKTEKIGNWSSNDLVFRSGHKDFTSRNIFKETNAFFPNFFPSKGLQVSK